MIKMLNKVTKIEKNNTVDNHIKKEKILAGSAYECIKDSIFDIDGAIIHLQKLGYKNFYLIGHSTGANKVVIYNYYKPDNKVKKYLLLAGGDDTGYHYSFLGESKYKNALLISKKKIAEGKGQKKNANELFSAILIISIII